MASGHRDALPLGTELEGYRLEEILGAGGFGITYRGVEISLEREVAIKEYLPSGIARRVDDSGRVSAVSDTAREDFDWGLDRFRQEAKVLVALHHRNIVPVLRFFEANDTAYLVMEYQHGESLGAILARDKRLDEAEILELVEPVLDGLASVHKAGFLHRDIKPDNIFIRRDGTPVLIDFGSARQALGQHSRSLTAVISEGYAPYEQYQSGGEQGPPTDLYAVGAVMYRCVTGQKPPDAPSRVSAVVKDRPDPMPPIAESAGGNYSSKLLDAIERALAVFEKDRPQDIESFRTLLPSGATAPHPEDTLAAATGGAGEPGNARQAVPRRAGSSRRTLLPFLIAGGVLFAVAGGGAAVLMSGGDEPQDASRVAANDQQNGSEATDTTPENGQRETDAEAEAERRRQAEAERQKREEEARRKAEEKAKAEAEAERRRQEEDARRRAQAEAERKRQEEEARRQAEAERKRQEEEDRRRAEAEARAEAERRQQEEAARRQAEREAEAERLRQQEEDAARREARQRAEAEAARRTAEQERKAEQEARQGGLRALFAGRTGYMNKETTVGMGTANMRFAFRNDGGLRFTWQVIASGSPEAGASQGQWKIAGEQVCITLAVLDGGRERCYRADPAPDKGSVRLSGPGELAGRMILQD